MSAVLPPSPKSSKRRASWPWVIAIAVVLLVFNVWMSKRYDAELVRLHDYCRSLAGSPSLTCLDAGNRFAWFIGNIVPWWLGDAVLGATLGALAVTAGVRLLKRRRAREAVSADSA